MPKILNYFQCFSFCKKKNNKKPLFSCLDVKGVRPILNRSDAPNLEQDSVILDNSDIAQSLDVAEIHVPRAVSPSNEEECLHISDKNAENNISSFSRNASLEGEVFGQVNLDKRFHLDGDLQGNKFLRLYYNPGTTEASSNVNEIIQRRLEEFKRLKNISPVHTLENIYPLHFKMRTMVNL